MAIGPNADERFNAVLVRIDWDRKIHTIKLVVEITGISIAGAKDFIEHLPRTVKRNVSDEEGRALRRRFDALGAYLVLESSAQPLPG